MVHITLFKTHDIDGYMAKALADQSLYSWMAIVRIQRWRRRWIDYCTHMTDMAILGSLRFYWLDGPRFMFIRTFYSLNARNMLPIFRRYYVYMLYGDMIVRTQWKCCRVQKVKIKHVWMFVSLTFRLEKGMESMPIDIAFGLAVQWKMNGGVRCNNTWMNCVIVE